MKRILSLFLLISLCCGCGTLSYNNTNGKYRQYLDGYWGRWEPFFTSEPAEFQGDPYSFIVYKGENHPSNFCFRIHVKDFDKDAVKKGAGTKFTGTIEYFAFQAAGRKASEDFVKRSLGYLDGRVVGSEPLVKRPVDIEVQKISGGYLYTFLFDGVGFSVVIPRHSVANE